MPLALSGASEAPEPIASAARRPDLRFLSPRHDYDGGRGWSRRVAVGGDEYVVGVEAGKRVRIPFKPRGVHGVKSHGYQWHGFVRTTAGETLWDGRVNGSLGCRGLLDAAGLLGATGEVVSVPTEVQSSDWDGARQPSGESGRA